MRHFHNSLIIPLIFLSVNTFAQNSSYKEIIALLDSAEVYSLSDPERCLQIANEVLSRLGSRGKDEYRVRALLHSANSKKMLSRKDEALQDATNALSISLGLNDPDLLYRSYFMKASIFGQYNDHDSTLIYYQKVIDVYRPGMDPFHVSSAYTNIGQIYASINNDQKAEEYLLKGYSTASEDDYAKLFALASVIGYYVETNNQKYLPYVDALANTDFYKNASPESVMAHFVSFLMLEDAPDEEIERTLREVYEYGRKNSSLVSQATYGMHLTEQLHKMGRYNEAFELLKEVEKITIESDHKDQYASVTYKLYENSKARNNISQALSYLEKFHSISNNLLSEENRKLISELNIKFEAAQKDHEIAQQKSKIAQERRDRNFFILLAILISALGILVFVFFRNRAKSLQRMAEQEKVIHRQETERLQKENEVAQLNATLESQERERNRIARDLHDGLGSMMSGISSQIEYLKSQPAIEHSLQPQLVQLRDMVKEASAELRRTSYELMPAKLLRLGLEPAIRDLCMNLLVKNGIEPCLEINGGLSGLNPEQQLTLYRIVQELLNNIVRHAQARNVFIQFTLVANEISLVVEDDGKGFDTALQKLNGGLGLNSLESRVNLLKGFLDIASVPGQGTTVTVNFDVKV